MRYFLAAFLMLISQLSMSSDIKNLVIFGDSLSDNGNLYEYMRHQLPQSPPYYDGRFSDGPVWAEQLAKLYFGDHAAKHLQDYAFGGAGVLNEMDDDDTLFTLRREVNTYLLAHNDHADPQSMFFVWIGGNNYLGLPDEMDSTINDVIEGIQKDIERLVKKGAKYVTIVNLPDLSKTPLAKELDASAQFAAYSQTHNQRLLSMFDKLRIAHPDVKWLFFDSNQIFEEVYAHASDFGFNHTEGTCYDALTAPTSPQSLLKMAGSIKLKPNQPLNPNACEGFVFFDLVHPTRHVHQLTAEHMKAFLDQEKLTFTP